MTKRRFHQPDHSSRILSGLTNLLDCDLLLDCSILCEGQTIRAHKVVLAAASDYFRTAFSSLSHHESTNNSSLPCCHNTGVIIKDMRFEDLKILIDFIYTGDVSLEPNRIPQIIESAESLKIHGFSSQSSVKVGGIPSDEKRYRSPEEEQINEDEEEVIEVTRIKKSNSPLMPRTPTPVKQKFLVQESFAESPIICQALTAARSVSNNNLTMQQRQIQYLHQQQLQAEQQERIKEYMEQQQQHHKLVRQKERVIEHDAAAASVKVVRESSSAFSPSHSHLPIHVVPSSSSSSHQQNQNQNLLSLHQNNRSSSSGFSPPSSSSIMATDKKEFLSPSSLPGRGVGVVSMEHDLDDGDDEEEVKSHHHRNRSFPNITHQSYCPSSAGEEENNNNLPQPMNKKRRASCNDEMDIMSKMPVLRRGSDGILQPNPLIMIRKEFVDERQEEKEREEREEGDVKVEHEETEEGERPVVSPASSLLSVKDNSNIRLSPNNNTISRYPFKPRDFFANGEGIIANSKMYKNQSNSLSSPPPPALSPSNSNSNHQPKERIQDERSPVDEATQNQNLHFNNTIDLMFGGKSMAISPDTLLSQQEQQLIQRRVRNQSGSNNSSTSSHSVIMNNNHAFPGNSFNAGNSSFNARPHNRHHHHHTSNMERDSVSLDEMDYSTSSNLRSSSLSSCDTIVTVAADMNIAAPFKRGRGRPPRHSLDDDYNNMRGGSRGEKASISEVAANYIHHHHHRDSRIINSNNTSLSSSSPSSSNQARCVRDVIQEQINHLMTSSSSPSSSSSSVKNVVSSHLTNSQSSGSNSLREYNHPNHSTHQSHNQVIYSTQDHPRVGDHHINSNNIISHPNNNLNNDYMIKRFKITPDGSTASIRGRRPKLVSTREVHGKNKCPHCPQVYYSTQAMNDHINNVHSKNSTKYVCRHCSKEFSWKISLNKHLRKQHGQPIEPTNNAAFVASQQQLQNSISNSNGSLAVVPSPNLMMNDSNNSNSNNSQSQLSLNNSFHPHSHHHNLNLHSSQAALRAVSSLSPPTSSSSNSFSHSRVHEYHPLPPISPPSSSSLSPPIQSSSLSSRLSV